MTAIILVLDSFGVGASEDAAKFGDTGANTLGSIVDFCNVKGIDLNLPVLSSLGLGRLLAASSGKQTALARVPLLKGAAYGYAKEISSGKDTPSGHWEMTGVPVLQDWGYFTAKQNSFPADFIEQLVAKTGVTGILGNCHSSGIRVIEEFGEAHIKSGKPICYTSADSVFQVAANEQSFGLENLYHFCEVARELTLDMNIGRVIARPFVGDSVANFMRTNNRKDYAIAPFSDTVLDKLCDAGGKVISIGKIADIFAHQGVTDKVNAYGINGLFDATLAALSAAENNSLIFTNFVDFDQNFGHRRDPAGYANALIEFDQRLPELLSKLSGDDLLMLTADHGCDPCWQGTDHTREHVPVMVYSPSIDSAVALGERASFADIGQTLADYFQLSPMDYGISFLGELGL